MKRFALVLAAFVLFSAARPAFAQGTSKPEDAAAYTKVIRERSEKIVAVLNISDKQKDEKVTGIITDQYRTLNDFHDKKNARIKELKASASGAALDSALKLEAAASLKKLSLIHDAYVSKLSSNLSPAQVDQVKDGMTYGVLPLTYKAYQDMLLNLTPVQKDKIMKNLVEARELAMDAESSNAKHAVFGKYKGRINNLLAADGYDLKKEGEEWQKRIAAAKAQ